jgi:hypothetical protein
MKAVIALFLWCILFALCWPLALLALVATPFVLLVALPFCLVGAVLRGFFAFFGALFLLPARVIGWRVV